MLFRNVRLTYHFLHHIHNLLLDHVQGLCVASGRSADDIVNLDIVVLLTYSSAVHGIGEFDENRILLHDALDVLASDTNDTLVILVGNMKRDGRRHFLLHKIQAVFGSVVLGPTYVDVKIIFIETIEYDLHVAYIKDISSCFYRQYRRQHTLTHDLVDLAILLATHKLLVLIG